MASETVGAPQPALARLAAGEIHVWWLSLDAPLSVEVAASLSADERERAGRFAYGELERRFVAGRGLLRSILGRYLDRDPQGLRFAYGRHGKPSLAEGALGLRFNLAHSEDVAAVALAHEREVGIDVECMRPIEDLDGLAARSFSPLENAVLAALPEGDRHEAFFACWTRKEAYLKALGDGLGHPLDAFDVAFAPGEEPRLLRAEGSDPSEWSLRELPPRPGYKAALAVHPPGTRLLCDKWAQ